MGKFRDAENIRTVFKLESGDMETYAQFLKMCKKGSRDEMTIDISGLNEPIEKQQVDAIRCEKLQVLRPERVDNLHFLAYPFSSIK